jgi:hypothetical protein
MLAELVDLLGDPCLGDVSKDDMRELQCTVSIVPMSGVNQLLPDEQKKIGGWRRNVELIKNTRRMSAVVRGVVHDMQQDVPTTHAPRATTNKFKLNNL